MTDVIAVWENPLKGRISFILDSKMRKFYILRENSDPLIIGVDDNHCQSDIVRKKFNNKDNFDYLMNVLGKSYWGNKDRINQLTIELERVELFKSANLTDILQFSPVLIGCPFMVSKKVKNILDTHNVKGLTFFRTDVFVGADKYEYYLMHIAGQDDNAIDYENSTFYTGNDIRGKKYLHFKSAGSRYFCESLFWASQPKQAAKT